MGETEINGRRTGGAESSKVEETALYLVRRRSLCFLPRRARVLQLLEVKKGDMRS
jgi:hypothetical protein